MRTKFQLFKNGAAISKPHSTWEPTVIEALERGLVTRCRGVIALDPSCEIKEVEVPRQYNPGMGHSF